VVSIWFHWDGTELVMATLPGAPKLKALTTGDRVAITIDTEQPPHQILSVRGTATVTEVEGVVEEYAKAAARYLGEEAAKAYLQALPSDIGMAASPCVPTTWWSSTSRPGSPPRSRRWGWPTSGQAGAGVLPASLAAARRAARLGIGHHRRHDAGA
jgi:hypothetical protein